MGRKKLQDSRDNKVTIRFNNAELAMLEEAFAKSYAGLNNISEFIRYLVMKAPELVKKTEETIAKEKEAVKSEDCLDYSERNTI